MAYQVLARKWRPRNFPEMIGQTHVVRALTNALTHNRLHHAYLFTGTRGVGKTTIARILAKSLNCETGVTAYPCGKCTACREINEGRFIDLIEVDAASRTKVEDTRELLENVQYAPTRGRYKVYLIDEVHMLTTHSFNALLKTLEEPPPHVKFLLATTDPQKLPATILSRCLQFSLKALPAELIAQHLKQIVETEAIDYEIMALRMLAQAADGSVRDALSLLDQAIAHSDSKLTLADVNSMLGLLDQNIIFDLVQALATHDASKLLDQIAQLAEYHPDFVNLLGDLLSLLQRIAITQFIPETIMPDDVEGQQVLKLAQQLSREEVQLFYQIALLGRRDLPLTPHLRGGFEMVMLRMLAFSPLTVSQSLPLVSMTSAIPQPTSHTPAATVAPLPSQNQSDHLPTTNNTGNEWAVLIQSLQLTGPTKQLALNCEFRKRENDTIHLVSSPNCPSMYLTKKTELEQALRRHYGESIKLNLQVTYAEASSPAEQQRIQETREQAQRESALIATDSDPFITQMKTTFNAQVNKVTPVKPDYIS
ncbi:MAG: DNA polymerase III subunit gamma/tau [Beggiatoa sp. IS2]|nr:MAG: DNA polymerase III subunit gamma/tau [Beggiatoa sp. IS2]